MVRPELGTKRLCPNCGAKYYDLNRDPIICPKCNASFVTGVVGAAREPENEDDELENDEGIELVSLDDAEAAESNEADGIPDDDDEEGTVTVDSDDDALIDDDDDDDEVSDVVRPAGDGDEDER